MNILESIFNNQNIIGSFEATEENVSSSLTNLASQFGMSNPTNPVNSSSKGITIKKNGKKYTIILSMFNPPVILNWTTPFDIKLMNKVINDIAKQGKKIGYINIIKMNNKEVIQIALG